MRGKKILNILVIILIVSLACAAIYAAETGEVSHSESSNGEGHIHLSGSGNGSHIVDSVCPINQANNISTIPINF